MKKIFIFIILTFICLFSSFSCGHKHEIVPATCLDGSYCKTCNEIFSDPLGHDYHFLTIDPVCDAVGTITYTCSRCGDTYSETIPELGHDMHQTEEVNSTCIKQGYIKYSCSNCDHTETTYKELSDHSYGNLIKEVKATCSKTGVKAHYHCSVCGKDFSTDKKEISNLTIPKIAHTYVNDVCTVCGDIKLSKIKNGFSAHGALHVDGADLVDENNKKTQLIGLSTHGLQWCGDFINYKTFKNVRDAFGINVIRLSLYPDEGGYCDCSATFKETLYQRVVSGIKYATSLDMYVILDWHMLGAENPNDKNPNYYRDEAKAFYLRILDEFPDNENLLFDIMNEPSPPTTFAQCKAYANFIIPAIREKTDGVILVGGINWSGTSSVQAWAKDPLTYSNIMYTLHFYAGDHESPNPVKTLYNQGVPIFVSEHGGMNNDGDGPISVDSITAWWNVLDSCNISYVAWNLSNTQCSASIFKYRTTDLYTVDKTNLKEWGLYYMDHVRTRFGFK